MRKAAKKQKKTPIRLIRPTNRDLGMVYLGVIAGVLWSNAGKKLSVRKEQRITFDAMGAIISKSDKEIALGYSLACDLFSLHFDEITASAIASGVATDILQRREK